MANAVRSLAAFRKKRAGACDCSSSSSPPSGVVSREEQSRSARRELAREKIREAIHLLADTDADDAQGLLIEVQYLIATGRRARVVAFPSS